VIADIAAEAEIVDPLVIDSQGDYTASRTERVWRPPRKLTWLQASNYALTYGFAHGYDSVVLLNNDTRLSPGFFGGLQTTLTDAVGLCGPVYDDVWPTQRVPYTGPAAEYVPKNEERVVPFLDGTCLAVNRLAFEAIGGLNEQQFGRYGWAADFDYGIRTRSAGLAVVATLRSYLNHIGQATAAALEPGYEALAIEEAAAGMSALYGNDWLTALGAAEMVSGVYDRVSVQLPRGTWGGD
jgi:hypothetical protein